jgi:hypothetical protein
MHFFVVFYPRALIPNVPFTHTAKLGHEASSSKTSKYAFLVRPSSFAHYTVAESEQDHLKKLQQQEIERYLAFFMLRF